MVRLLNFLWQRVQNQGSNLQWKIWDMFGREHRDKSLPGGKVSRLLTSAFLIILCLHYSRTCQDGQMARLGTMVPMLNNMWPGTQSQSSSLRWTSGFLWWRANRVQTLQCEWLSRLFLLQSFIYHVWLKFLLLLKSWIALSFTSIFDKSKLELLQIQPWKCANFSLVWFGLCDFDKSWQRQQHIPAIFPILSNRSIFILWCWGKSIYNALAWQLATFILCIFFLPFLLSFCAFPFS